MERMMETDRLDWPEELPRFVGSLLLPVLAGGGGGIVTRESVQTWYPTLRKPSFNPPSWIFGPVWSTLYLLMGIAHYLVVREQADPRLARQAHIFYGLQLALNTLWSLIFFGRRSPLAALIEIVFLWIAIVLTIVTFARISPKAALLLMPYLLWVSFAALLNGAIWRLNA
jgi:tryptophan-rich sensory protein